MSFDYLLKLANHCAGIKHYRLEDEINNFILNNIRIAEDMVDNVKSDDDIKAEFKKLQKAIDTDVRKADIRLLSVNADPKTFKSFKSGKGYLTGILYLAPYTLSGQNVCPCASKDCIEACLHTAGNPAFMKSKEKSRISKTQWFFGLPGVKTFNKKDVPNRNGFLDRLKREIVALHNIALKYDLKVALRLNGTSDIGWHGILREFIKSNPHIKFYDYTKVYSRAKDFAEKEDFPIHQTFSRSEENHDQAMDILEKGGNVAVVFDKVPHTYHGYHVIVGDEDDLRFLDDEKKPKDKDGKPLGLVIGLKAKGGAIRQYKKDKADGYGPEQKFVVRALDMEGFPYL